MAFDLNSLTPARKKQAPIRAIVYGPPGVGKTTFAACFPKPVILPTEDGLASLSALPFEVATFPVAKTWADVMEALGSLYTGEHDFKTLIVDSLDWLEPLVWAEACRINGWPNIEAPGYGKGYLAALDVWSIFLEALEALRAKGMAFVLIGHAQIKRYENPETDPYDRYMLKLHQRAEGKLTEAVDMVLFANFLVAVTATDVGFNKKVKRGVGSGERVMHTEERPAFYAKNRHALPASMPFTYEALAAAMAPAAAPVEAGE